MSQILILAVARHLWRTKTAIGGGFPRLPPLPASGPWASCIDGRRALLGFRVISHACLSRPCILGLEPCSDARAFIGADCGNGSRTFARDRLWTFKPCKRRSHADRQCAFGLDMGFERRRNGLSFHRHHDRIGLWLAFEIQAADAMKIALMNLALT